MGAIMTPIIVSGTDYGQADTGFLIFLVILWLLSILVTVAIIRWVFKINRIVELLEHIADGMGKLHAKEEKEPDPAPTGECCVCGKSIPLNLLMRRGDRLICAPCKATVEAR